MADALGHDVKSGDRKECLVRKANQSLGKGDNIGDEQNRETAAEHGVGGQPSQREEKRAANDDRERQPNAVVDRRNFADWKFGSRDRQRYEKTEWRHELGHEVA